MADFDFHEHKGELRLTYEPDNDGRGTIYWIYTSLQKGPWLRQALPLIQARASRPPP